MPSACSRRCPRRQTSRPRPPNRRHRTRRRHRDAATDEPGVYGLVYRHDARENTYSIVFRPTYHLVLRRLILFHELAHLLFNHLVTDVGGEGALRGYMVTDAEDAVAEAFAVGAMQYSF